MSGVDTLIRALAADARPVRRLPAPGLRTLLWLALAGVVLAVLVAHHGVRPDLAARFATLPFTLEWLGAVATGIGAAVAAFHRALPDRSRAWLLAPLPGAAIWASSMGLGCWSDWIRLGPAGFQLGTSWGCMGFIASATVPLALILAYLLRHAAPVRPVSTMLLATLSVSALAAAGQSLAHGLDTSLMILVWHFGTIALLLVAARLSGRRLLGWMLGSPPASSR